MNTDIIIARRPTGQISLISALRGEQQLKAGWDYIKINRLLIPQVITKAKLWDYIMKHHGEDVRTWSEDPEKEYHPNLPMVKARQEEYLKNARLKRLQYLDGEWFKAQEGGSRRKRRRIEKLKGKLREMDYTVGHLEDPAEVLNYYPLVLMEEPDVPPIKWWLIVLITLLILASIGGGVYGFYTAGLLAL